MEKKYFAVLCILFHLLFAFFQIYKRSALVKFSYEKQRIEAEILAAQHEKKINTHTLELLKDRLLMKEYGKSLGMEKVTLNSIKRISL